MRQVGNGCNQSSARRGSPDSPDPAAALTAGLTIPWVQAIRDTGDLRSGKRRGRETRAEPPFSVAWAPGPHVVVKVERASARARGPCHIGERGPSSHPLLSFPHLDSQPSPRICLKTMSGTLVTPTCNLPVLSRLNRPRRHAFRFGIPTYTDCRDGSWSWIAPRSSLTDRGSGQRPGRSTSLRANTI